MITVPRLMVVLDRAGCQLPIALVAKAALAGGADMIQIREKSMGEDDLRQEIETIINAVGGPERISINGRSDLAERYGTHLHLPEAMPFPTDWFGPERLIGRSVHVPVDPLDPYLRYVVLGTIHATGSKPGTEGIGLEGLSAVTGRLPIPVLAIGGMESGRIAPVLAAGAHGVAVRSAVIGTRDPEQATRAIREEINQWINQ